MANNSVNIGINVSDNGSTVNLIKTVKNLKDLLTQTASIASSINLGGVAGGGRGGSPRSATAPSGTAGSQSASQSGGTYAQARASIGTGAEARDFARQSEGLGGLVRLYATYAANIYAAGAAFRALSEAANTANIVQGLNQLGAASGVALGNLSKQFAEASGGAISFRDAMQSTAQATSAGLSSKQFLQLGEVAKKASQALGINMSDAVSRLTRGISKLEPELLDELGLFTKLGKSTEDYAKSVGKSASSLTDFEKRQAFANAVLTEGLDKFSGIDIPTNPYDKLSASLANLSYESLNIVNKALGPLIDQLSQSPKALLAIVAGIAAIIIKQAIPALSQFRENMVEAASVAEARARSINDTISSLRQMGPPTAATSAHEAVMKRLEDRARRTAIGYSVLSNAIDNTRTLGPVNAFRLLRAEIDKNAASFSGLTRAALVTRGALSIGITTIGSVVSAFSGLLMGIGAAIASYQLLSSWLSKNSEDLVKYNEALKYQDEAVVSLTNTTKKYFGILTIESVLAQSTAFSGLADSINKTADALSKAETNSNWFDKLTDSISSIWGGDLKSKFAESATTAVVEGLKGIKDPEIRKEAEEAFKRILGVSELTEGLVKEAAKGVDPTTFKKKFAEFQVKDVEAAKPLQGLTDGFKEVNKTFLELSNSLLNNDPLSKFASTLIKQVGLLDTAFKQPFTTVSALNSILKDTSQIQAFPPGTQQVILDVAKKYKEVYLNIKQYTEQQQIAREDIGKGGMLGANAVANEALATKRLAESKNQAVELQNRLAAALSEATKKGFEVIQAPLSRALSQASIESQKTLLSYLPKTSETAKLQADLEIQSIDLKRQELVALRELTNTLKLASLKDEKDRLKEEQAQNRNNRNKFGQLQLEIDDITAQELAIKNPKAVSTSSAKSPSVAAILQQNVGYETQLQQVLSQQNNIRIKGIVDSFTAAIETAIKKSQESLEDLKNENKNFYESIAFTGLTDEAKASERARRTALEQQQIDVQASLRAAAPVGQATIIQQLAGKNTSLGAQAGSALAGAQERQKVTEDTIAANREITSTINENALAYSKITKSLDVQLKSLESMSTIGNIKAEQDSEELDALNQKLDFEYSLGKVSEDDYENQKRLNDLKSIELNLTKTLAELDLNYLRQRLEIAKELANPNIGASRIAELTAQTQQNAEIYAAGVSAAEKTAALKTEGVNLLSSIDKRTQAYADIFKSTVSSMSDALVEFALTGKASFSGLIKSMIVDLIKFEQRKAMSSVFEGLGGFTGLAAKIFGAASGQSAGVLTESEFTSLGAVQPGSGYPGLSWNNALGGVYDQGRVAFAKGGAFTNTIVTKPTTFAFAKGTGLMGESGPEAIMPLKRGANGSLGVQSSGGGNVDVVVNNYGSEKATTKESTDSRGNRRIEVIVGEMTAAEMNRPNSPVQTSMRSTFGLAPTLTRR